jgi:hypothetical protein
MTIGPFQLKVLGLQHPDRTFTARITEEPERSPKTDTVRAIDATAISKAASEELEAMHLRSPSPDGPIAPGSPAPGSASAGGSCGRVVRDARRQPAPTPAAIGPMSGAPPRRSVVRRTPTGPEVCTRDTVATGIRPHIVLSSPDRAAGRHPGAGEGSAPRHPPSLTLSIRRAGRQARRRAVAPSLRRVLATREIRTTKTKKSMEEECRG